MNNIALILSKMEDRVKHEIWYIENWNIWLDIHIRKALIFFMGTKVRKEIKTTKDVVRYQYNESLCAGSPLRLLS